MSRILILDFGSQYTQLIARRVRELGVYSELHRYDVKEQVVRDFEPSGIILSGGPESVTESGSPRVPEFIYQLGVPVLGICYGMQSTAEQSGGNVEACEAKEFGYAKVNIDNSNLLFKDLPAEIDVWMSHGDQVKSLPVGFEKIGSTETCPIAAMFNSEKRIYGLQFHPEVTHTKFGKDILSNFVHDICLCDRSWSAHNIIETAIKEIREQVGKDRVVLGLSGGVDSSVVAALLTKAIGKQLYCVFVDTGLLRKDEGDEVEKIFAQFDFNFIHINAQNIFYDSLKGINDPEEKRKIAGYCFIQVFEAAAKDIEGAKWLAQGTIYPDVIESAAASDNPAHVIKSHHNVGGLPEKMDLKLLEPLRHLFKDEVRQVGLELGLPKSLIFRHPFPGPGLTVRILGEIQPQYIDILQQADAIFIHELREHLLYDQVAQAFAVFLPVKSVGVKGDARAYEYVIALRAVETTDFMTAHWAHLPYDFIGKVANRIMNEVPHVSRVVYDVSGKPPRTSEWE